MPDETINCSFVMPDEDINCGEGSIGRSKFRVELHAGRLGWAPLGRHRDAGD